MHWTHAVQEQLRTSEQFRVHHEFRWLAVPLSYLCQGLLFSIFANSSVFFSLHSVLDVHCMFINLLFFVRHLRFDVSYVCETEVSEMKV